MPRSGTRLSSEKAILAPIAVCCLVLGVYPKPVLDTINVAVQQHVLLKTAGTTYVMDVEGSEDDAPLRLRLVRSEPRALARADLRRRQTHGQKHQCYGHGHDSQTGIFVAEDVVVVEIGEVGGRGR